MRFTTCTPWMRNEAMLEKYVEQRLRQQVEKAGGLCLKFVSPGYAGVPDRICLFPGGKSAFVELKAPQGRLRPIQVQRHAQLRDLGFSVFVVNDPDQIPEVLELLTVKTRRKKPAVSQTTTQP